MTILASLELSAIASHSQLQKNAPSEFTLLTRLCAREAEDANRRQPVEIAVVLDRSASMEDRNKLGLCKKTLTFLINECLCEQDRMSLVTFDSSAAVVFPSMEMTDANKAAAVQAVEAITVGHTTNLSGGLFAGIAQISKHETGPETTAVLVLTDGLANGGITDRTKLLRMTQNQLQGFAPARRPSVYTLGFGSDVDSELLMAISQTTEGSYYAVVDLDDVPLSFADIVGGLLSITAQNICLTLTVPPNVTITKAITKYPHTRSSSTTCQVSIKDMHAGETREVAFKLHVLLGATSPLTFACACTYSDVLLERQVDMQSHLDIIIGPQAVLASNDDLTRAAMRLQIIDDLTRAKDLAKASRLEAAREVIQTSLAGLEAAMAALTVQTPQPDLLLSELRKDLLECQANLVDRERWTTVGVHTTTASLSEHTMQRATRTPREFLSSPMLGPQLDSSSRALMSPYRSLSSGTWSARLVTHASSISSASATDSARIE